MYAGPALGLSNLFFKLENCNPSGSYKDRFVVNEIRRCLKNNVAACVATSSGNTGSSLAAYCARYGVRCFVIVNADAPAGKLEQMQAHSAQVFRVNGFISSPETTRRVFDLLSRLSLERNVPLIVSAFRYCPEAMSGVETISHELQNQLPGVHHVFVPVGGGGLFSAVCRGFRKGAVRGPRIHAVQPRACSTVVAAFERGDDEIVPIESHTRVSGLSVPFDIDASLALGLLRECGGAGFAVEDDEVFEAQQLMLSKEGIYCEPAGAAALAGLRRAVKQRIVKADDSVVCLVTGHGFKDPESIRRATRSSTSNAINENELESSLLENAR
jgi:threonine synthase